MIRRGAHVAKAWSAPLAAAITAVVACGGATAIEEGSGERGESDGAGAGGTVGGKAASGGTRAAGGAGAAGTTAGSGGRTELEPCRRGTYQADNPCPSTLQTAAEKFRFGCDRPTPESCVIEEENCGLVAARLSGPYPHTCLYDANTGEIAGVTILGKAFFCEAYTGRFPPSGFTRGLCGAGSFDSPYD